MKKLSKIFFVLGITFIYSCKEKAEQHKAPIIENVVSPSTPINDKKLINELLAKAINNGDKNAYNKVSSYYILESKEEEFLYFSMKMANKYNNPEACFHVYFFLAASSNGETLEKLDEKTKKIALYYLLRAYELGVTDAQDIIPKIFGDKIPKSSDQALCL